MSLVGVGSCFFYVAVFSRLRGPTSLGEGVFFLFVVFNFGVGLIGLLSPHKKEKKKVHKVSMLV